jgi:hypothetical protein
MLSTPFIIDTWFAGLIIKAMRAQEHWRWGYGMFSIIMPVVLGPAIATLIYLDRRVTKDGIVNMATSRQARRAARAVQADEKGTYCKTIESQFVQTVKAAQKT